MQKKKLVRVVVGSAVILLVPLVAMQFTDEVNWDLADFVIAGTLLTGTGTAFEFLASRGDNSTYRAGAALAAATALFLVWTIGAVGLIGAEGDPFDAIYGVVIGIGVIGAVVARFQPQGMARALSATAIAQALVVVIALLVGKQHSPVSSVAGIAGVNGFFVALWVLAAGLFRAASDPSPSSVEVSPSQRPV